MSDPLPPLSAFRVFDAAARHLSFTRAAHELNVTPAAVSQQIRALEAHYGLSLFHRTTRGMTLTAVGMAVLPSVQDGLGSFQVAHRRLQAERKGGLLTVSVYPSLAEKWLIPRLERFRAAHPDIDLRIDASFEMADFERDGVDIAIRYGGGQYPDRVAIPFLEEVTFPVASPTIAARLSRPDDLRNETLIHNERDSIRTTGADWPLWLKAARVDDIDPTSGIHFNTEAMLLRAALDGLGVALGRAPIVRGDLDAGRLVAPFGENPRVPSAYGHFLVYPKRAERLPKVIAFRDWALSEDDSRTSEPDPDVPLDVL